MEKPTLSESDIEDFIWSQSSDLVDVTTFSCRTGPAAEGSPTTWRDHLLGIYRPRLQQLQDSDANHDLQRQFEHLLERLTALHPDAPITFWVAKSTTRTYTGLADHQQVIFCSSSVN
ncbi:hypothetical protein BH09VER1_BH09VER1_48710 [soil metagenome]